MGDLHHGSVEPSFLLGEWTVEPEAGTLRRGDQVVHLEPKVMELLVYLAERSGRVVPKQELFDALWPDTFVAETALSRCVSQLRHALRDDTRHPRFIETVPKKGYRVVAPQPATPSARVRERFGWRWAAAVGSLALGSLALLVYLSRDSAISAPEDHSLAVLPLANAGTTPELDYLSVGLTQDIVAELSQFSGLRVVSRARTDNLEVTGDRRRLAEVLGVSFILEGSYQQRGELLHIVMTLADPGQQKPRWHQEYNLALENTLQAPRDIARNVAAALGIAPTAFPVRDPDDGKHDPEAYRLVLLARYFRSMETTEALGKAVAYYRKAIAHEPGYAQAHAGLAESCLLLGSWETEDEWAGKAQQAAAKALALNPRIPESHIANGMILRRYHRDFAGAEAAFREALRIDPRNADARREYGLLLLRDLERLDEALVQLEAAASLDPLSKRINSNLAELYRARGDYDKALEIAKHQFELNPLDPRGNRNIALAYFLLGDLERALPWALASVEMQDKSDRGRHFERGMQLLTLIQLYSGRLKDAQETSRRVRALTPTSPQGMATAGLVALWTGDLQEAASRLEAATQADPTAYLWPGGIHVSTVLGHVLAELGDAAGSERALALSARLNGIEAAEAGSISMTPDRMLDVAALYALRRDRRAACRWLKQALDSGCRSFVFVRNDPWFVSLRDTPEFREFCSKAKSEIDAMLARVESPPAVSGSR